MESATGPRDEWKAKKSDEDLIRGWAGCRDGFRSAQLWTASPLYERGKINACADDEKEIETKTGAELGATRKKVDFFFSSRDEEEQAATKMARQDNCEDLQCHRPFKSKMVEEQ
ncbi:hypothetical protein NEUTE2DRAFT_130476 [Neurospora tetrasperma FGSC 2509]|nr:hypothetical protein NEUTE2DRAFT_130476 [Neurospora tetrasperma FGSC 2509]